MKKEYKNFEFDLVLSTVNDAMSSANVDHFSFSDELRDIYALNIWEGLENHKSPEEQFFWEVGHYGCVNGAVDEFVRHEATREFYFAHADDLEVFVSSLERLNGAPIEMDQPRWNSVVWLVTEEVANMISFGFDESLRDKFVSHVNSFESLNDAIKMMSCASPVLYSDDFKESLQEYLTSQALEKETIDLIIKIGDRDMCYSVAHNTNVSKDQLEQLAKHKDAIVSNEAKEIIRFRETTSKNVKNVDVIAQVTAKFGQNWDAPNKGDMTNDNRKKGRSL